MQSVREMRDVAHVRDSLGPGQIHALRASDVRGAMARGKRVRVRVRVRVRCNGAGQEGVWSHMDKRGAMGS